MKFKSKAWAAVLLITAGAIGAAEVNDLNIVDGNNTARFPENMAPSAVNDGARALEGIIARWDKDTNGSRVSTGSANAYVVAANRTLSALYDGLTITFEANFVNTGSATLNVDSLGAKTIRAVTDVNLTANDIRSGQKVTVRFDSDPDIWQMVSPRNGGVAGPTSAVSGNLASYSGTSGGTLLDSGISAAEVRRTGTETIWIPAGAMLARSSTGAASEVTETTSNLVAFATKDFDGAVDEFVQFNIGMPPNWARDAITPTYIWPAASGSGTVQWFGHCLAVGDSDVIDAAFGTAVGTTDTLLTAGDEHLASSSAAITCSGSPAAADLIFVQVFRDASADSHAADAKLIGVRMLYRTNAANDD